MGADYKFTKRQQLICSEHTDLSVVGVVEYISPVGSEVISPNIWDREMITGRHGMLHYAYVRLTVAPGGVASRTFTLYINGAPTAIAVTITGAAQNGQDLVNAVAVNPFDEITWHSDGGVGGPAVCRCMIAIGFTPY